MSWKFCRGCYQRALTIHKTKINQVYQRNPRTGLALLHRNFDCYLANAICAGAEESLSPGQCRELYCELLTSLSKEVNQYLTDPGAKTLPLDIVRLAYLKAYRLGRQALKGDWHCAVESTHIPLDYGRADRSQDAQPRAIE